MTSQNPNPETTAIVKHERNDALIFPKTMDELFRLSKILVSSGLLPISIKTPEQAATIILKGRELSIPPMEALNNINVIQGKPTLGCHLIAALVLRAGGRYQVLEKTERICRIKFIREGMEHIEEYTFEKATKMGLTGKDNWRRMPANMLYARCMSEGARIVFPDALGGIYTTEEMNPNVTTKFTETGEQVFEGVTIDSDTGEIQPPPKPEPKHEDVFLNDPEPSTDAILAETINQPPPKKTSTAATKGVLKAAGKPPSTKPVAPTPPEPSPARKAAQDILRENFSDEDGHVNKEIISMLWEEYMETIQATGITFAKAKDADDDTYGKFVVWAMAKKEAEEAPKE